MEPNDTLETTKNVHIGSWTLRTCQCCILKAKQRIGTIKVFDGYCEDSDTVPDILVIKTPKFWDWNTD